MPLSTDHKGSTLELIKARPIKQADNIRECALIIEEMCHNVATKKFLLKKVQPMNVNQLQGTPHTSLLQHYNVLSTQKHQACEDHKRLRELTNKKIGDLKFVQRGLDLKKKLLSQHKFKTNVYEPEECRCLKKNKKNLVL